MAGRAFLGALALLLVAAACGSSKPAAAPAVLFVSTRDGDYALYGVDATGMHERRLTKEKGDPSTESGLFFQGEPAWSPDGREVAFVSRRDGHEHVYVVGADGKDTRRVTDSAMDDDRPSWSPDGRRLVFSREGALFVAPAAGGKAHRLGHGFGEARDPAWSPDGKLIADDYRQPCNSIRGLFDMRVDGTGIRQLTHLRQVSGLPAWSPDGRRLAFQSDARGGHDEIYVVGVDGKGLRRLTASTVDAIQPAWSPDGKRIAFSRDGAIWTADAAGGDERQLTSGQNDSSPAWRPVRAAGP
jgi:Tol biopolymer transport system component